MFATSRFQSTTCKLLFLYIFFASSSWASFVGDEYQVDVNGIIAGSFPGGFTQEEYITQFELGNGGEGTSNPPVTFGTPNIVAGWIRPVSQSSSFLTPGSLLIQDSLTPTSSNSSKIFFDIQGIENPGPNQIINSIFINTLQQSTTNSIGNVGIDIVGVSIDSSLTGNVSVSNPILTLFYDDMSALDVSNNLDVEIISFGINPSGDFGFSADINPSLFQTVNGLNATRFTLEASVTTIPLPASFILLLSSLGVISLFRNNSSKHS